MNEKNNKLILERIRESAKRLEGRLPDRPDRHPKGRNPYVHIPKVIKHLCGQSYTELPDEDFNAVMVIIEHCEKNPF
jgi:hypothetical protein